MSDLTSTVGIIAVAGAVVAVIALATSIGLAISLRRLRAAQRAVLGERQEDLVAHAASLQNGFEALTEYVHDVAARLDGRVTASEQRLDGVVAYRSLVRYDAYGEMSGRQSTSIALLDARKSGIVLSSIHHREHARLYAKQIHEGSSDLELSPEEQEAVRLALNGGPDESAAG